MNEDFKELNRYIKQVEEKLEAIKKSETQGKTILDMSLEKIELEDKLEKVKEAIKGIRQKQEFENERRRK